MELLHAVLVVTGLGALGGLMKSFLSGFEHWSYDKGTKTWKPGWLGHLITGGVGSVVVWAIYGPYAGQAITTTTLYPLTLSQAGGSLLVGIGGAKILTMLADRKADAVTKNRLTEALKLQGGLNP